MGFQPKAGGMMSACVKVGSEVRSPTLFFRAECHQGHKVCSVILSLTDGQEKTSRWRHLLSKASLPLLFCAAVVEGSLILEYGIKAFDSKPHIGHTIILSQFHVWDT